MTVEVRAVDLAFHRRARADVVVLTKFSLKIPDGSVVALVGPSGCGKSTILRLVAGLLVPDAGTIEVGGRSAAENRGSGRIGFVFQDAALMPWRTVASNVGIPFEIRGVPVDADAVEYIVHAVGLSNWADRYPNELSGGMKQRVALARALVTRPPLLLLDEPFSQLDELLRFDLLFAVQAHAAEFSSTVMLVTHDITEAVLAADVVYVLPKPPVVHACAITVPLPRPRVLGTADQPEFHDLVSTIRTCLAEDRRT